MWKLLHQMLRNNGRNNIDLYLLEKLSSIDWNLNKLIKYLLPPDFCLLFGQPLPFLINLFLFLLSGKKLRLLWSNNSHKVSFSNISAEYKMWLKGRKLSAQLFWNKLRQKLEMMLWDWSVKRQVCYLKVNPSLKLKEDY